MHRICIEFASNLHRFYLNCAGKGGPRTPKKKNAQLATGSPFSPKSPATPSGRGSFPDYPPEVADAQCTADNAHEFAPITQPGSQIPKQFKRTSAWINGIILKLGYDGEYLEGRKKKFMVQFIADRFAERFAEAWMYWAPHTQLLTKKINASMQRVRRIAAKAGRVHLNQEMVRENPGSANQKKKVEAASTTGEVSEEETQEETQSENEDGGESDDGKGSEDSEKGEEEEQDDEEGEEGEEDDEEDDEEEEERPLSVGKQTHSSDEESDDKSESQDAPTV